MGCAVEQPAGCPDQRGAGHFDRYVTLTLIFRLARRMYVHHQSLDASIVIERYLGVSRADAREPIDLVALEHVPVTRYTFYGNSVASEERKESIPLSRLLIRAGSYREKSDDDSFHSREVGVA